MRGVQVLDGALRVVDGLSLPEVGAGQVRLRVEACGICGSDLSLVKDAARFVATAESGGFELARFDPTRPVTPGHEFAGVVVEVADDVSTLAPGDRVAGIGIATDHATGALTIVGYSNTHPGALAEEIVVDAGWLRVIPDAMSFDVASLAEPLHVGETHVQQSGWRSGPAVVIGAGTIGLGVVIALVARGCSDVVVVEPSPRRRELALALGATRALDPAEHDLAAVLAAAGGPVTVFECSGRQGAIAELTRIAPHGSHLQIAASAFGDETFVPVIAQWRQLVINFGSGPVDDPYGVTLQRLADGEIDAERLITARMPLPATAEAFAALRVPDEHVKIIIRPNAEEPA
ncbi:alcohol dehydrogenase catalytic domain-containing protein [Nocardioides dubius]|uniref:Zinc-binding dehydrogenase n=1 Tax=Nocardioides dubius TaxID=317019 RepID=A0ABP4EE92_9ACTN